MTYYKKMTPPDMIPVVLWRVAAKEAKQLLATGMIHSRNREWVEYHRRDDLLGVIDNGRFVPYYTERYWRRRTA